MATSGSLERLIPTEASTIATPAEIQLVYVFSALLVLGAIFLAFIPALRHASTFVASRRILGVLAAVMIVLGVGAILLVNLAVSDPVYFVPIAGITVALRLSSPFLLYRRIQDRFEATKPWGALRWLAVAGFLGLAALLAYHVVLLASGTEPPGVAVLSERLVMALGASVLIVRAALRIRPREATEMWPLWSAAVLFAVAFVLVLPYAIPAFEIVYAASGLVGWSLGILVAVFDV